MLGARQRPPQTRRRPLCAGAGQPWTRGDFARWSVEEAQALAAAAADLDQPSPPPSPPSTAAPEDLGRRARRCSPAASPPPR